MFDINTIIEKLSEKRKIFVSEADFQLELAWIIKNEYPKAKVRLEYCPDFNSDMHIDILVKINNEWIPIELKYKTKACEKKIDGEVFRLKNHSAKNINSYLYLKDIQRIESIRKYVSDFSEGYTIFITNEPSYLNKPQKTNCGYKDFSLEQDASKNGHLDWGAEVSEGTKKNCKEPIELEGTYKINWNKYSEIDDTNTGTFWCLINKIAGRSKNE